MYASIPAIVLAAITAALVVLRVFFPSIPDVAEVWSAAGTLLLFFVSVPYAALEVAHETHLSRLDLEESIKHPKFTGHITQFLAQRPQTNEPALLAQVGLPTEEPYYYAVALVYLENDGKDSNAKFLDATVADTNGKIMSCTEQPVQQGWPMFDQYHAMTIHEARIQRFPDGEGGYIKVGLLVSGAGDIDKSSIRLTFEDISGGRVVCAPK